MIGQRIVLDRYGVLFFPTQERDAAVLYGSRQIGGEFLFGQTVLALVPDVDEQFLNDVLRFVVIRDISVGYAT